MKEHAAGGLGAIAATLKGLAHSSWSRSAQALRQLNPGLVYVAASGWGQDGPLSSQPGLDIMAQARSGLMSITGEPGGESPWRFGVSTESDARPSAARPSRLLRRAGELIAVTRIEAQSSFKR